MPYVGDDLDALVADGSVVRDPETGHCHERHSGIRIVDWRDAVRHRHIFSPDDDEDLYAEPWPTVDDDDIPDGPSGP